MDRRRRLLHLADGLSIIPHAAPGCPPRATSPPDTRGVRQEQQSLASQHGRGDAGDCYYVDTYQYACAGGLAVCDRWAPADAVLRYRPQVRTTDDLAAMPARDDNGYGAPCMGCDNAREGYYGIMPTPRLVAPPVAVVPFLGATVAPLPQRLRLLRDGRWISEPDPRFQYLTLPVYPYVVTAGSAYFPTPEYPNFGRLRIDEFDHTRDRR